MSRKSRSPWASGPLEILTHGLKLMAEDSDTNRRLAMIAIDNSVELMMRTFLALPKRVTGISFSRRKYQELGEGFADLLSALEQFAPDRLQGIHIAEIEWYHRLRNELYHQGNGLTVERQKLIVYAGIARLLFRNLFGIRPTVPDKSTNEPVSQFLALWTDIEGSVAWQADLHGIRVYASGRQFMAQLSALERAAVIPHDLADEVRLLRTLRNNAIHSELGVSQPIRRSAVNRLQQIAKLLDSMARAKAFPAT